MSGIACRLLSLSLLFFLAGCAVLPLPQQDGVHRMARYEPSVTATPAGVPAVVNATQPDVAVLVADDSDGSSSGFHHVLSAGDEVMTSLRGIPKPEDLRNVIDAGGRITLPLIGQIEIAGMTTSEAERKIEQAYVEGGYFRSINVIMVSEDKSYFVQGEVGRQGRFRLSGEVTLLKAIAEAGGYSPFANRRNVKVIRGEEVFFFNAREIANGREPDPPVQSNDIIVVLRSVF